MNAKKHTPLSLHGLRLLFPPLATLGILFLTEWIARGSLTGETFTQYIFPHAEAYLLAWAMLFLSWLAVDWLTRFAPLATLLAAVLGCAPAAVNFYTLQLRGEPFLPWDLMQVSEAAGVGGAGRGHTIIGRGSCGRYPHPDQHGGIHSYYRAAGRGVFLPL